MKFKKSESGMFVPLEKRTKEYRIPDPDHMEGMFPGIETLMETVDLPENVTGASARWVPDEYILTVEYLA